MAQIRFDGIYHKDDIALWLRFHPGNTVTGRFIKAKVTPSEASSLVAEGLGGFGAGTYELSGDALSLHLTFPFGVWRYSGKLVEEGVELKYLKEGSDYPAQVYTFHPLGARELEPNQTSRAHSLRRSLAAQSVERGRVEAAAAIGDPVAMLALQPYLEIEQTAARFAALGAGACMRLLLALTWSDDGVWYTPKQGVVKGGSRKEEEGKTLRAIAKWCLKPADKTLTKVEQEFAEVTKIGPAFQLLDAAVRVIKAADEAARCAAMKDALTLHLAQDLPAAFELARAQVVPWLMGTGDPLADTLERIK